MATPQQLLAQAGRRAPMQDLSGAQDGTITGAHGGTQQLGPAALARLRMAGDGGQTPGIVPSLPGAGSFANGTGDRNPGGASVDPAAIQALLASQNQHPLSGGQDMPPPPAGVPLISDGYDSMGGRQDRGKSPGVDPGAALTSLGSYGEVNPSSSAPYQDLQAVPTSTGFNLPGFRPVSPVGQSLGARGGEPPMSIDSYSVPTPDPNSARQALSTQQPPIARPPNPATSPFGASPSPPPPPSPSPSPSGALRPMIADQGNVQAPGGPQGFRLGGFRPKPFIRPQQKPTGQGGSPRPGRSLGSL